MRLSEINELLLSEKQEKELEKIEKYLKIRIKKEKYVPVKQELILLLLISLVKKNRIETNQMKILFNEMLELVEKIEADFIRDFEKNKSHSAAILLDVFYKTNIYRLFNLETFYRQYNIGDTTTRIRVLRKDLERADSLFRGDKKTYYLFSADRIFSKYGTSFWSLGRVLIVLTLFFACLYYICDVIYSQRYVGGGQLMSFDYYIYVSVITMSNLGGDVSMAGNLLLRAIFIVQQIIGVTLFGVLITLVGKNFD